PADPALDVHLRPVDQAAAEVPQAAVERDLAAGEDGHAERVLRARVAHRHLLDALLVEQPAQLQVDLACGHRMRVELGRFAVDLGDPEHGGVGLDQSPRVVGDAAFAHYRVHTSTSPSYGSYVSIS